MEPIPLQEKGPPRASPPPPPGLSWRRAGTLGPYLRRSPPLTCRGATTAAGHSQRGQPFLPDRPRSGPRLAPVSFLSGTFRYSKYLRVRHFRGEQGDGPGEPPNGPKSHSRQWGHHVAVSPGGGSGSIRKDTPPRELVFSAAFVPTRLSRSSRCEPTRFLMLSPSSVPPESSLPKGRALRAPIDRMCTHYPSQEHLGRRSLPRSPPPALSPFSPAVLTRQRANVTISGRSGRVSLQ